MSRLPAALAASRRAQVALGGAVVLGLVPVAGLLAAGPRRAPRAAVITVPSYQEPPVAVPAVPAEKGRGDVTALAYLRAKDAANAGHVSEIVWTGPMLRVYTDLPGSQADSKAAVALCRTAAAYLAAGGRVPMVFVHARELDGYPVLANKMGTGDGCRLNDVP